MALSEVTFFLLTIGVLIVLGTSAYLHFVEQRNRRAMLSGVMEEHRAQYLRYLAYVSETHKTPADPSSMPVGHPVGPQGHAPDIFGTPLGRNPDHGGLRQGVEDPQGSLSGVVTPFSEPSSSSPHQDQSLTQDAHGPSSSAGPATLGEAIVSKGAAADISVSGSGIEMMSSGNPLEVQTTGREDQDEDFQIDEVLMVGTTGSPTAGMENSGTPDGSAWPGGVAFVATNKARHADARTGPALNRSVDAETIKTSEGLSRKTLLVGVSGSSAVPAAVGQAMQTDAQHPDGRSAGSGRPRRVQLQGRGSDVWTRWPDVNAQHITGTEGLPLLRRTFEVLMNSQAKAIADDLFRRGIAISFGQAEEFSGDDEHAVALFVYSTETKPPDTPDPPPELKFNPNFLNEDPRVLAAVLAHEGTHFQQYLDGTLHDPSASRIETETAAWINGAVLWQQIRLSALPLNTPLVRELELGYQVALQGEGWLRDLVAVLYP